jgi:hypothetical protein
MKRHRIDFLSLVLGLIACAIGIAGLAGGLGDIFNEGGWFVPLAVALVAFALLASVMRRDETAGSDRSAELAVAGITEPRHDESTLVEMGIDGGGDDVDTKS